MAIRSEKYSKARTFDFVSDSDWSNLSKLSMIYELSQFSKYEQDQETSQERIYSHHIMKRFRDLLDVHKKEVYCSVKGNCDKKEDKDDKSGVDDSFLKKNEEEYDEFGDEKGKVPKKEALIVHVEEH